MAQLITKRYKNEAFYDFIDLRRKFWNFQFTILIICLCITFPTTLIDLYRQRQEDRLDKHFGLDKKHIPGTIQEQEDERLMIVGSLRFL